MANKLLKTLRFSEVNIYDLAPNWKNVQDKPFGYETPTGGDTLTWDGTTSGLESVMGVLYHVHDATPTVAEGTIEINSNGTVTSTSFTVEDKNDGVQYLVANNTTMAVIVPTDGITVDDLTFNKAGIYLRNTGGEYVSLLTINDCEDFAGVKTLDYQYLPKSLRFGVLEGSVTVEVLPTTEFTFVEDMGGFLYSNIIQGIEEGKTYGVNYNGVDYECEAVFFSADGMSAYLLGNSALMMGTGDTGEPFTLMILTPESFEATGGFGAMAIPIDGATSVTLAITGKTTEKIKTLDIKYLPPQLQIGEEMRSKNITWNGSPTKVFGGDNQVFYKVSSYVPTLEEFNGKTCTVKTADGQTQVFTIGDTIDDVIDKGDYISGMFNYLLIVKEDGLVVTSASYKGTYPERGIYFSNNGNFYISNLNLGEDTYEEVKRFDSKYLPSYAAKSDLKNKVDKEAGKGLSTKDFTATDKDKLSKLTICRIEGNSFNEVATGYDVETDERIISYSVVASEGAEQFNHYLNKATGSKSHAEGSSTTASGAMSHAEGYDTLACARDSHAEGYYTVASGDNSHAEGYHTVASGDNSHAEGGSTKAHGISSHAEGGNTIAKGYYSHAEGLNTIATTYAQHVQGKYNIEDTENKYAHIVGNGTSVDNLSNAHTLDWNGNAWFKGKIEATEIILKSVIYNSTKRFRITVDDSGTLKATEITE